MPFDPNNARHRSLGPGAHTEDRAVFFRVQYDPIQRTGEILFQHRPHLYVGGVLSGVLASDPDRPDKLYRQLSTLVGMRPAPGAVLDPVTGADLATVSGAGIQTWLEWLFDALANEPEPQPEPEQPVEEPTP